MRDIRRDRAKATRPLSMGGVRAGKLRDSSRRKGPS